MAKDLTHSKELFEKAARLMPGGVNSPVRAFNAVGGQPIFMQRGDGAELVDVDGNRYVDFCQSWGPLILGHWAESIRADVTEAMAEGLTFGCCSPREVACAERVLAALPGCDKVRFTSSGTEAVMTALRLARGITGRPKILKFEGCYHGHSDGLLVKAGSGLATSGIATSKGVPETIAAETVVIPLDDEAALDAAFGEFGKELAAVVIEPLPGNAGLLEQRPEYLKKVRDLCREHGALFIADEVINGFRLRYGSYSDTVDLDPDLITLGKIVGGGMPVGAVAGPAKYMDHLAPLGPVYQAGTLSGNPVAMAAGAATLNVLAEGKVYDHMESLGQTFDAALKTAGANLSWLNHKRLGSIIWLHCAEGELPRRSDKVSAEAVDRFNRIHPALLERGYYLPPSGWEVMFLSAAHTPAQVTGLAETLAELLGAL